MSITEEMSEQPGQERIVVVYARVSANENRPMQERSIEIVNVTKKPIEAGIADFVSILYSFCARLYGQRRAKRKTEKIVQDLNVKAEQKTPQEVGEERAAS